MENPTSPTPDYSDIVLVVVRGGRQYQVHKAYLIASSPVFEAMFLHYTTSREVQRNRVDIPDMDSTVFEALLHYLYNDSQLNEQSLSTIADQLLIVADKYQIDALKRITEQHLASKLTTSNVLDLLLLSDYTNSSLLKSKCIEHILANFTSITQSAKWKQLVSGKTNQKLTNHILLVESSRRNQKKRRPLSLLQAESQSEQIPLLSRSRSLLYQRFLNLIKFIIQTVFCILIIIAMLVIIFLPINKIPYIDSMPWLGVVFIVLKLFCVFLCVCCNICCYNRESSWRSM